MSDFYRDRDRLVGGTDNQWSRAADFSLAAIDQDGDPEDTADAGAVSGAKTVVFSTADLADNFGTSISEDRNDAQFSGVLSQSELAS